MFWPGTPTFPGRFDEGDGLDGPDDSRWSQLCPQYEN